MCVLTGVNWMAARALSPAVQVLLALHGLRAAEIVASGPKGHILKGDVLAALTAGPRKAPSRHVEPIAASVVANMKSSGSHIKVQVPHAYLFEDVCIDKFSSLSRDASVKVEYFLVKAAGLVLRANPSFNALFSSSGPQQLPSFDVGLELAANKPLAYIQDADSTGVSKIASTADAPTSSTRGCSLAVSTLGGCRPIPSGVSAILSLSLPGTRRVVVKEDGTVGVENVATIALSFDARAIDENIAAEFLTSAKRCLERPVTLL
eukprot:TRINITY_DN5475_c0_g1_i1.p1 TRINITY_DN5475_c0_g1~~TRINITY_DN5475_c0_g1_i1.p1  ORF type:complete len:263 (-),score=47.62 TRINITY_DN5475_c0_g1_i1:68-856(-)